jgi:hypothetical protein
MIAWGADEYYITQQRFLAGPAGPADENASNT